MDRLLLFYVHRLFLGRYWLAFNCPGNHADDSLTNLELPKRFEIIQRIVLSDGLHFAEEIQHIPYAQLPVGAGSQKNVLVVELCCG